MPPKFTDAYELDKVRAAGFLVDGRSVDHGRWRRLTNEQLGVSVLDPDGHKMGMNIAYRTGAGLNWYPASPYKQTLVGLVDRYGFYDPGFWTTTPDEADWNIYIVPDRPFAFLIEDVLSNADIGGCDDCVHEAVTMPGYCMEAEITPDEHFYDNPYFNSDGTSSRVGQRIGVYGPWVMEEAHGWRPEIHPSEALWWREAGNSPDETVWTIMIMQDDSNRFDRNDDYRGRVPRPWSANPRRANIDIAIELDPGYITTLELSEVYGRNVRVSDVSATASVTANWNGQPVATLTKVGATGTHVNARFGYVQSDDGNQTLHTFLQLKVEMGIGDRGGEGYLVLELRKSGMNIGTNLLRARTAAASEMTAGDALEAAEEAVVEETAPRRGRATKKGRT